MGPETRIVPMNLSSIARTVVAIAGLGAICGLTTCGPLPPDKADSSTVAPAPKPTGLMYVKLNAPCAKDRDSNRDVARALRDKDQEALEGLLARGKIFSLTKGTRFEVSDPGDFAWGFVRSGRNTGETCYILSAFLVDSP